MLQQGKVYVEHFVQPNRFPLQGTKVAALNRSDLPGAIARACARRARPHQPDDRKHRCGDPALTRHCE